MKPKVVAVVGPTASGKTSLAIEIGKRLNGEVISADSRQVYRGLDIGSGKVTNEEMQGVRHHLIDIVDPATIYTGHDFVRDATAALSDIRKRGRLPILAGGTFFYLELLCGQAQAAPAEPNHELRQKLELLPSEELFERLFAKDERRAESIDRHNRRRLIRALEIIETLGVVPESSETETPYNWLIIGIDIDQSTLQQNIHTRLHTRLQAGMVAEVERLHEDGVSWQRLYDFGLEYRYVSEYLQGHLQKDEMVVVLETKIRQFAKRQLTWLKRMKEIEWYAPENREAIFRRIEKFLDTPAD